MADSAWAQTIRESYQAFSEGDIDAVMDLLADDVELRPPPTSPDPDPLHGREAVRKYLSPDMFESQTAVPIEILEAPDRVLVTARIRNRGRASGIEIDETIFHLWHVDDQRVVRFEAYLDRDQAMSAFRA